MSGNSERRKPLLIYDQEKPVICYGDDGTICTTTDITKVNCVLCIEWLKRKGLVDERSK